jgi:hypothetical protein
MKPCLLESPPHPSLHLLTLAVGGREGGERWQKLQTDPREKSQSWQGGRLNLMSV